MSDSVPQRSDAAHPIADDAILIRCPSCQHALNLPNAYLGQIVTCLECRTPFRAPVREGDRLTEPQLLPKRTRVPARLFIPMYGLMLLGFTGLFVNSYLFWWFGHDPKAAAQFAEANLQFLLETKPPAPANPPAEPARDAAARDAAAAQQKQDAEEFAQKQQEAARQVAAGVDVDGMRRLRLIFAIVSAGVLVGGFCMALRVAYPFCFVACGLSALNTPDLGCCFFGAVVGIWGVIVLISDEGRAYFGRSVSGPISG